MCFSNYIKEMRKNDLSVLLYEVSVSGYVRMEMSKLLYRLDISNISCLEKRVLKQFYNLREEDKPRYADNIILANNLPICVEFNRIVANVCDKEKYISKYYSKRDIPKAEIVWNIYEKFLEHSEVLRQKVEMSKKDFAILRDNSSGYSLRAHRRRLF